MGAHVLAPRPTEIIVSIGNIDDASAGHGSHVPVSLDQHTPAPAPGLDAGLDAGCVEPAVEELSRRVESAPTAGKRRKLAVCLAWATLVPGAAYDHGLPAGRVGELEAWAHRPGAVRQGQADHDQRLVEPFLPGRDTQIFTVYDTHPDYAPDLFALAVDGLKSPRLTSPGSPHTVWATTVVSKESP